MKWYLFKAQGDDLLLLREDVRLGRTPISPKITIGPIEIGPLESLNADKDGVIELDGNQPVNPSFATWLSGFIEGVEYINRHLWPP